MIKFLFDYNSFPVSLFKTELGSFKYKPMERSPCSRSRRWINQELIQNLVWKLRKERKVYGEKLLFWEIYFPWRKHKLNFPISRCSRYSRFDWILWQVSNDGDHKSNYFWDFKFFTPKTRSFEWTIKRELCKSSYCHFRLRFQFSKGIKYYYITRSRIEDLFDGC